MRFLSYYFLLLIIFFRAVEGRVFCGVIPLQTYTDFKAHPKLQSIWQQNPELRPLLKEHHPLADAAFEEMKFLLQGMLVEREKSTTVYLNISRSLDLNASFLRLDENTVFASINLGTILYFNGNDDKLAMILGHEMEHGWSKIEEKLEREKAPLYERIGKNRAIENEVDIRSALIRLRQLGANPYQGLAALQDLGAYQRSIASSNSHSMGAALSHTAKASREDTLALSLRLARTELGLSGMVIHNKPLLKRGPAHVFSQVKILPKKWAWTISSTVATESVAQVKEDLDDYFSWIGKPQLKESKDFKWTVSKAASDVKRSGIVYYIHSVQGLYEQSIGSSDESIARGMRAAVGRAITLPILETYLEALKNLEKNFPKGSLSWDVLLDVMKIFDLDGVKHLRSKLGPKVKGLPIPYDKELATQKISNFIKTVREFRAETLGDILDSIDNLVYLGELDGIELKLPNGRSKVRDIILKTIRSPDFRSDGTEEDNSIWDYLFKHRFEQDFILAVYREMSKLLVDRLIKEVILGDAKSTDISLEAADIRALILPWKQFNFRFYDPKPFQNSLLENFGLLKAAFFETWDSGKKSHIEFLGSLEGLFRKFTAHSIPLPPPVLQNTEDVGLAPSRRFHLFSPRSMLDLELSGSYEDFKDQIPARFHNILDRALYFRNFQDTQDIELTIPSIQHGLDFLDWQVLQGQSLFDRFTSVSSLSTDLKSKLIENLREAVQILLSKNHVASFYRWMELVNANGEDLSNPLIAYAFGQFERVSKYFEPNFLFVKSVVEPKDVNTFVDRGPEKLRSAFVEWIRQSRSDTDPLVVLAMLGQGTRKGLRVTSGGFILPNHYSTPDWHSDSAYLSSDFIPVRRLAIRNLVDQQVQRIGLLSLGQRERFRQMMKWVTQEEFSMLDVTKLATSVRVDPLLATEVVSEFTLRGNLFPSALEMLTLQVSREGSAYRIGRYFSAFANLAQNRESSTFAVRRAFWTLWNFAARPDLSTKKLRSSLINQQTVDALEFSHEKIETFKFLFHHTMENKKVHKPKDLVSIRPEVQSVYELILSIFPDTSQIRDICVDYVGEYFLTNPAETDLLYSLSINLENYAEVSGLALIDSPYLSQDTLKTDREHQTRFLNFVCLRETALQYATFLNKSRKQRAPKSDDTDDHMFITGYVTDLNKMLIKFRGLSPVYRTLIIMSLINEKTGLYSDEEGRQRVKEIFLGDHYKHEVASLAYDAYLAELPLGEERVFLSGSLATFVDAKTGSGVSPLAQIVASIKVVGPKAAQFARAAGLMSPELSQQFDHIFDQSSPVRRDHCLAQLRTIFGKELRGMAYFGRSLGFGSVNHTWEIAWHNPEDLIEVISTATRLRRTNIIHQVEGNITMAKNAARTLLQQPQGSPAYYFGSVVLQTFEAIESGFAPGGAEVDFEVERNAHGILADVYSGKLPRSGRTMQLVPLLVDLETVYIPENRRSEAQISKLIRTQPLSSVVNPGSLALDLAEMEARANLSGFSDADGHPGNQLISIDGENVYRTDIAQLNFLARPQSMALKEVLKSLQSSNLSSQFQKSLSENFVELLELTVPAHQKLALQFLSNVKTLRGDNPIERLYSLKASVFTHLSQHTDIQTLSFSLEVARSLQGLGKTYVYSETSGRLRWNLMFMDLLGMSAQEKIRLVAKAGLSAFSACIDSFRFDGI